jgi:hypothetical protein
MITLTDISSRSRRLLITCLCLLGLQVLGTDVSHGQELGDEDDFSKGGRAALQFLKIGIGARQAALGEASIASVRDVNSVFWNPAGTSAVESFEASFSYTKWLADLNYMSAAAGFRWGGVGVLTLGVSTLDYGDIEEALVTSVTGSNDTRTGNTFSGDDMLVTLGFSREFTDRLSIGISAKWVRESLTEFSESILLFDVGTNYDMRYKGFRLAMSAQNFGTDVKFLEESTRTEGFDVPLIFRVGFSGDLIGPDGLAAMGETHRLTASIEAVSTNDFSERFHVGGEYWFGNLLAFRGGYRFNYDEGNFSAGFGLNAPLADTALRLDYTYVAYEFLDAPHRFTLSLAL